MKLNATPARILRRCTALLASSAVLLSGFVQSVACGYEDTEPGHYSLIPDDPGQDDPYAPYYLSGNTLFAIAEKDHPALQSNIQAWSAYFDDAPPEDIVQLIFNSTPEELKLLEESLKSGNGPTELFRTNAAAKWLVKHRKSKVMDYLTFSKKCEKHFTKPDYGWYESSKEDTVELKTLLVQALVLEKQCKDKEIRLRYRYQILRLHFYLGDYAMVNRIYEEDLRKSKWNNDLMFSARNYDFGASFRLMKKKAEVTPEESAAVLLKLAGLFSNCSDCNPLLFEDLHHFDAADFFSAEAALSDTQSRIDLWMLASLRSVPLHICMDKILALNPNAPELESLLAEILRDAQSERFRIVESTLADYFAVEVWNQTQFILKKAVINTRIRNAASYGFLLAYLDYMNGKIHKSRMELEQSRLLNGSDKPEIIRNQRILSALLDLESWSAQSLKKPHLLPAQLSEVLDIDHEPLTRYVFTRLYEVASQNEDMVLEKLLFVSMIDYLPPHLDLDRINLLESSYHSQEKSIIERWVWAQKRISLAQIQEWKADALLAAHRFAEAAEYYEKAGSDRDLYTDPFVIHINDCHDCDHADYSGLYTVQSFCEKMVALKSAADKGDAHSAFLYANGLYNKSHFGNSRDAVNLELESSGKHDFYWDMSDAAAAYQRAFVLYKDRENKAKMVFMLAKCEQNNAHWLGWKSDGSLSYYYTPYLYDGEECQPDGNREMRSNFEKLRKEYQNTAFYKEALKECTYFEHYVRVH